MKSTTLFLLFFLSFSLSSGLAFPLSMKIKDYFPCAALYLSKLSWERSYFEPTLLPFEQQEGNKTFEARSFEVGLVNFTCDFPVSTTHIFRCNPNGFSFQPTSKKIKASILFLHGLLRPMEAAFYVPVINALLANSGPLYESIRIEMPLAPLRITTFNRPSTSNETASHAWLDVVPNGDDRLSLYRASQHVEQLALSLACLSRHSMKKVLLVGHSLGAFTALEFALSTDNRMAGVIAISGALPRIADYALPPAFRPFNTVQRDYNITMIHGTKDETVPFSAAQASAQVLDSLSSELGFGYELIPLEGLDHSDNLVQSPLFYAAINKAAMQVFS